jgi:hypothetical protein
MWWMGMTCIEFTVIPVALCWCVLNCSCQCICVCFVFRLNTELIIDWKILGELPVPLTLVSTVASLCSWMRHFVVTHFYVMFLTFCDWFWWNAGWDHLTCKPGPWLCRSVRKHKSWFYMCCVQCVRLHVCLFVILYKMFGDTGSKLLCWTVTDCQLFT